MSLDSIVSNIITLVVVQQPRLESQSHRQPVEPTCFALSSRRPLLSSDVQLTRYITDHFENREIQSSEEVPKTCIFGVEMPETITS
jgi:hypothetical protein